MSSRKRLDEMASHEQLDISVELAECVAGSAWAGSSRRSAVEAVDRPTLPAPGLNRAARWATNEVAASCVSASLGSDGPQAATRAGAPSPTGRRRRDRVRRGDTRGDLADERSAGHRLAASGRDDHRRTRTEDPARRSRLPEAGRPEHPDARRPVIAGQRQSSRCAREMDAGVRASDGVVSDSRTNPRPYRRPAGC